MENCTKIEKLKDILFSQFDPLAWVVKYWIYNIEGAKLRQMKTTAPLILVCRIGLNLIFCLPSTRLYSLLKSIIFKIVVHKFSVVGLFLNINCKFMYPFYKICSFGPDIAIFLQKNHNNSDQNQIYNFKIHKENNSYLFHMFYCVFVQCKKCFIDF